MSPVSRVQCVLELYCKLAFPDWSMVASIPKLGLADRFIILQMMIASTIRSRRLEVYWKENVQPSSQIFFETSEANDEED